MSGGAALPYPRPAPARRVGRPAPLGRAGERWLGWTEVVGMAQYLMPAAVFLPFVIGPVRTFSRVAGFTLVLLAWFVAWQVGAGRSASRCRRGPGCW